MALNIGGIANITAIPANAGREAVTAFDTGPGNMVIDALVHEYTQGRQKFDRDGRIGRRGKVHRDLLDELLEIRTTSRSRPRRQAASSTASSSSNG